MKTMIRVVLAAVLFAATAAPLMADGGGPAPKPIGSKGTGGHLKVSIR
jgi:hypothetical protein